MKKLTILVFVAFAAFSLSAQNITGSQLLDKAIQYHDPNGNWETFKGTLFITMNLPNKPNRDSEINIDLPNEFFYLKATTGKNSTEYTIDKGKSTLLFNGKTPSDEEMKEYKLEKNHPKLYQDYYTYLYGLPMKLKDEGTIIHDEVNRKKFKGKEYLVLKVTYKEEIGKETWFFYFDPETYAMEVYQFLKDSESWGEYILLTDIETVNGIKMPKNRAWYYNHNNEYLATDVLKKGK